MKHLLVFSFFCSLIFSCSKNESNHTNDHIDKSGNPSEPAQTPPTPVMQQELKLESEKLVLTHSGTPWIINKFESTSAKDKTKIVKQFLLSSGKKQTINFKDGWQHLEKSKCDSSERVEILATIKVDSTISTSKYSEIQNLVLEPNQDLILKLEINNTSNCQVLSFEFGIIGSEILIADAEEPKAELKTTQVPTKVEDTPKETWIIDMAEETVQISDPNSSEIPSYVYKHRTTEASLMNPNNKFEKLTTYTYVIDKSLELQCTFKKNIIDTSDLTAAKCQMKIIPQFASDSIEIVRGTDNKSKLISINITNQKKIQELCKAQVSVISSAEESEILNADGSKLKIPRLKLSCKYDDGAKDNFANFQGVLTNP